MLTQNLPSTATEYARAQRAEQKAALAAIRRQWRLMGNDFDASWLRVSPTIMAILGTAQLRVADNARDFIPAVLEDTGQLRAVEALASTNTRALVGLTGAGMAVQDALSLAPIRAKQAVAGGDAAYQGLVKAGAWLSYMAGGILSDTKRSSESLGMYTRNVGGYIRVLNPPSCSRCVILAGKWYRKNQGFSRHEPTCDCYHIPASESVGSDMTINPDAYYRSLDDAGRLKLAGSMANFKALEDGADLTQIVNAYRRTSGMSFAQVSPIKRDRFGNLYTTEGTTRRGLAGQQQTGLRRNGRAQMRLMPESIYRTAKSQEDALRLLKLYGWISDSEGLTRGRAIFAEQRRTERNARARARRAS